MYLIYEFCNWKAIEFKIKHQFIVNKDFTVHTVNLIKHVISKWTPYHQVQ